MPNLFNLRLFSVMLISLGLMGDIAYANCRLENNASLNFSTSYVNKRQNFFTETGATHESFKITMKPCEQETGNYFMLGMGSKNMSRNHLSGYTAYFKAPEVKTCTIETPQTSLKIQEPEIMQTLVLDQLNAIRECMIFKVTDKGGNKLIFEEEQTYCKVTPIDDFSAYVKGGLCFFQQTPNSRFEVEVTGNPNCMDRDFLVSKNIHPQDLEIDLGYFYSGDDTGSSSYLNNVGFTKINLFIEGEKKLLSLYETWDPGLPRVPGTFVFPNIQIPEIRIETMDDSSRIEIPWYLDYQCKKNCHNGLCSSPCSYKSPIVGDFKLYQSMDGGSSWQLLDQWYQGSLFYPNWQGLIDGFAASHRPAVSKSLFNEGETYRVVIEFQDPRFLWEQYELQLDRTFNQIAFDVPSFDPDTNEIPELPGLPDLSDVVSSGSNVTDLGVIPDLNPLDVLGGGLSGEPIVDLVRLKKLMDFYFFPPYYSKICDQSLERCVGLSSGVYQKFDLTFDIKELVEVEDDPFGGLDIFDDNAPKTKEASIGNVKMTVDSMIGEKRTFSYDHNQFMGVSCEYK